MSFSRTQEHIFHIPPLISFKRDYNIGNFLVRSAFKSENQPGTFKCTRTRCKTCPFISDMVKISGPNWSVKITHHFRCISANFIYCITCTPCTKAYLGETGRRLADLFREHLRNVEKNDTDASKPFAHHFNLLLNYSNNHNMTICGLSLQKVARIWTKNSSFNKVNSILTEPMNASHSINLFTNSCYHISINGKASPHPHKNQQHPQFLDSLWRRANARNVSCPNHSRW